ncbi:sensor histidine kinase [Thiocystis violascens]|uniref:histidine kinase n=1 Tax=Thiocystis violascens (strain ATCC 17096 / DSM 198 / 6111) TaxID=765911 RepID=I3Y8C2_THIV6|nr:ATP-binding protein [Thiocystis violascens]AFL73240.1 PAS domain S-box [Thiocystis violascens DSM 198]
MVNRKEKADDSELLRWKMRVMEAINSGVSVADAREPDLPLVYANPAFLAMTGYTAAEILGRNCRFLQAHDTRQPEIETIRAALREGRETSVLLRNYRKDGSLFWNQLTLAPVRDQCGQITHYVGIQQDMTALKEAQMLAERAQRYAQSIIDSLQALICVVDVTGAVQSVNRSWRQCLASSGVDLTRLSEGGNYLAFCDQCQCAGQEEAGLLAQGIRDVLAGTCDSFEIRMPLCVTSRHETYLIRVKPLLETIDGRPAVVISHQDVTAELQFQVDLRKAKEEAEQANQAKSDFLSQMSHELRTPMNAVLGFAQLLECDDRLDEIQLESVQEILHGGRQLLRLLNELLDLSNLESGQIDVVLESVVLESLVSDCFALVEPLARVRGVVLRAGAMRGLAMLADRRRLKQLLVNLLSNAILYNSPEGCVSLDVLPVQDSPRALRLWVSDTGPGIPPSRMTELFQPFQRLNADDPQVEGNGIGLAACGRIAEAMGGRVGVESVLGEGSRFWIELPLAEST